MNHVLNDYCHDYGTIVHAISACALAAARAADESEQGSITGFQASCVMWDFIRQFAAQRWRMKNSKMKNYKTQLVKIYGETRALHEWSLMYEIPFYIIMKRYIEGWVGDTLLLPYRDHVVEYIDVHSLWGGKWVYGRRKKQKTRNKKAKWVYVGVPVESYNGVMFI